MAVQAQQEVEPNGVIPEFQQSYAPKRTATKVWLLNTIYTNTIQIENVMHQVLFTLRQSRRYRIYPSNSSTSHEASIKCVSTSPNQQNLYIKKSMNVPIRQSQ